MKKKLEFSKKNYRNFQKSTNAKKMKNQGNEVVKKYISFNDLHFGFLEHPEGKMNIKFQRTWTPSERRL